MLAHKFPDPYVDILKHFASAEYADAEKRGDVSETIDKTIGKKCVALRGKTAAANYLALPKPGSTGLGVRGAYLYLELCLLPGAAFTLHFDLLTDAKFVARVTLSSRYTSIKQVGTVVQLPGAALAVTAGRWTVLGVDLAALTAAVVEPSKGQYSSLKGLMACCSMNLRAAFTSDIVYTPETLPRDFVFPLGRHAWADTFAWRWLPGPPASTTLSASELAVSGAALAQKEPPPQASVSPRTHPAGAKGSDEVQAARRRRQRSGAAPRALFPPPPKATAPADPTLLELSRVLGYSGERSGLLVWMKDGRRVLYAAAAILILQDIDTGAQRFLIGHTADVCTLSAAQTKPVIASAQLGTVPIIRLWDSEACTPLAILQQHASDMHTLSLSADGALLAAVGKDRRGRQLLAVWDVSEADAPIPSCPLLDAKVSQTHIRVIQWVRPRRSPICPAPCPLPCSVGLPRRGARGTAEVDVCPPAETAALARCCAGASGSHGHRQSEGGGRTSTRGPSAALVRLRERPLLAAAARPAALLRHAAAARGQQPLPLHGPRHADSARRRRRAADAAPSAHRLLLGPPLRHRPEDAHARGRPRPPRGRHPRRPPLRGLRGHRRRRPPPPRVAARLLGALPRDRARGQARARTCARHGAPVHRHGARSRPLPVCSYSRPASPATRPLAASPPSTPPRTA